MMREEEAESSQFFIDRNKNIVERLDSGKTLNNEERDVAKNGIIRDFERGNEVERVRAIVRLAKVNKGVTTKGSPIIKITKPEDIPLLRKALQETKSDPAVMKALEKYISDSYSVAQNKERYAKRDARGS